MEIWVFNGEGSGFPSGLFSTRRTAEDWIAQYGLSGILTLYPLDTGVYDWAIQNEWFRPSKPLSSRAIGGFTSAYQKHYHYEHGRRVGDV
jgi:hypothetical protein